MRSQRKSWNGRAAAVVFTPGTGVCSRGASTSHDGILRPRCCLKTKRPWSLLRWRWVPPSSKTLGLGGRCPLAARVARPSVPSGWPFHGQRKQLRLGSGLSWPTGLGQGAGEALDSSFRLLHSPRGGPRPEAAREAVETVLPSFGHCWLKACGKRASTEPGPELPIPSWQARGLLATPGTQAARAGRPESSRLLPTCPPPGPTPSGLRIPLQQAQAQMSEGSCAIGGDGQLFQGPIKLARRLGGLGPGSTVLQEARPPGRPALCRQSPEYPVAVGGRQTRSR